MSVGQMAGETPAATMALVPVVSGLGPSSDYGGGRLVGGMMPLSAMNN